MVLRVCKRYFHFLVYIILSISTPPNCCISINCVAISQNFLLRIPIFSTLKWRKFDLQSSDILWRSKFIALYTNSAWRPILLFQKQLPFIIIEQAPVCANALYQIQFMTYLNISSKLKNKTHTGKLIQNINYKYKSDISSKAS